jgi:predicted nicotinamide N-methyase
MYDASTWTEIGANATAAFLERCGRAPDRFFYPCNAKHRDPVCQCYTFCRQNQQQRWPAGPRSTSVNVRVVECAYNEGGTGWRVWPCALLLSCWLAANERVLKDGSVRVLEVGCGLGLPGLTAAALGAEEAVLSDCLPLLLRTLERSVRANSELVGQDEQAPAADDGHHPPAAPSSRRLVLRVASLDWDEEAPVGGDLADEAFSTEQGVKSAQLAGRQHGETPPEHERPEAHERFGLILASDVIYSMTHATQLPLVIAQRLDAGGTLAAMLPVRSKEHAGTFLKGLHARGMRVRLSRVDRAWIRATVAPQLAGGGGEGTGRQGQQAAESDADTDGVARFNFKPAEDAARLVEGEIIFVEAVMMKGDEAASCSMHSDEASRMTT